jgi:hypothetical protein
MRTTTPGVTSGHGSGRGVSDAASNANKRSDFGMGVTDCPDDLVQTQAAWNITQYPSCRS